MEDNYIIAPVVEGQVYEPVVKVGDTLPIGTEVDYEGSSVPNGWEEVNNDSGWVEVTYETNFRHYDPTNNKTCYRKIGNQVFLKGAIMPTAQISANQTTTMFKIPEGYRPPYQLFLVCQGSAMNKWLLSVQLNGNVTIERYGTTENIAIPKNSWLPITAVSWLVD